MPDSGHWEVTTICISCCGPLVISQDVPRVKCAGCLRPMHERCAKRAAPDELPRCDVCARKVKSDA